MTFHELEELHNEMKISVKHELCETKGMFDFKYNTLKQAGTFDRADLNEKDYEEVISLINTSKKTFEIENIKHKLNDINFKRLTFYKLIQLEKDLSALYNNSFNYYSLKQIKEYIEIVNSYLY